MNLVIVQETIPYVLSQRKNATWGRTFADLGPYGRANPGKLKYISNGVGSGNDIATSWILTTFGLQVKKMPQQNAGATLSVIGAGEGDFALATSFATQPHWQAGRVDPVLVTGPSVPPPWNTDPNVVTMVQAGLPLLPMGIVAGFSVPKQTPQSHIDWLFNLFKAGALSDAYRTREKTIIGCTIEVLTPKEANELKMKIYAESEPVVRAIGLHWDQQK